jgi:hypothetical protein
MIIHKHEPEKQDKKCGRVDAVSTMAGSDRTSKRKESRTGNCASGTSTLGNSNPVFPLTKPSKLFDALAVNTTFGVLRNERVLDAVMSPYDAIFDAWADGVDVRPLAAVNPIDTLSIRVPARLHRYDAGELERMSDMWKRTTKNHSGKGWSCTNTTYTCQLTGARVICVEQPNRTGYTQVVFCPARMLGLDNSLTSLLTPTGVYWAISAAKSLLPFTVCQARRFCRARYGDANLGNPAIDKIDLCRDAVGNATAAEQASRNTQWPRTRTSKLPEVHLDGGYASWPGNSERPRTYNKGAETGKRKKKAVAAETWAKKHETPYLGQSSETIPDSDSNRLVRMEVGFESNLGLKRLAEVLPEWVGNGRYLRLYLGMENGRPLHKLVSLNFTEMHRALYRRLKEAFPVTNPDFDFGDSMNVAAYHFVHNPDHFERFVRSHPPGSSTVLRMRRRMKQVPLQAEKGNLAAMCYGTHEAELEPLTEIEKELERRKLAAKQRRGGTFQAANGKRGKPSKKRANETVIQARRHREGSRMMERIHLRSAKRSGFRKVVPRKRSATVLRELKRQGLSRSAVSE